MITTFRLLQSKHLARYSSKTIATIATIALRATTKIRPIEFTTYLSTMATSRTILITPENTGLGRPKQTEAAAKKITELLQKDLEDHYCFFNDLGFHNHISHHILALYGVGAPPESLLKGYNENTSYQRSAHKVNADTVEALKDFEKTKEKLGNRQYYNDFLAFFQSEIDAKGWKEVLLEHLFKGDERSDDLLSRLFSGLLHPLIQLMYGLEWEQPAMIAMGLAQAAVHGEHLKAFLVASEAEAAKKGQENGEKMPEVAQLYADAIADEKLTTAGRPDDTTRLYGVLERVFDNAVRVASRVRVEHDDLNRRTVEMYNTAVYHAASAALRPGKEPRFDFFLMHHVNASPFFLSINAQDWIPTAAKVRLLEWKIRLDVLQYAAHAGPPASLDKIVSYVPKSGTRELKTTEDLMSRIYPIYDDGHIVKLLRSILICQDISQAYKDQNQEGSNWLRIQGDDLWAKVKHLVIDAAEGGVGETNFVRWVRSVGDANAWKDVPDQK